MIVKNKTHFLLFLLYLYYLQVTPIIYLDLYSTIFILILLILLRFFLHKKYLHSTIFILILNSNSMNVVLEKFTFYYIYINTQTGKVVFCKCLNLHSTIFILILNFFDKVFELDFKFTFYYIYINTIRSIKLSIIAKKFTFYYIYINTLILNFLGIEVRYLHSTIFILIQKA